MVESVVFRGVTYRRYPGRRYFEPGIRDAQQGAEALHRDVWAAAYGPIPEGHDVHHIDFDPSNNTLENLRALPAAEHQALHVDDRRESGAYCSPERLAHLDRIRPLAAPWHSADPGREWHSRMAREAYTRRSPFRYACERCGAEYESRHLGEVKFCSNKCRAAARRASGADDVARACRACGNAFKVNRYRKTQHCSRACAAHTRASAARGGLQPDG